MTLSNAAALLANMADDVAALATDKEPNVEMRCVMKPAVNDWSVTTEATLAITSSHVWILSHEINALNLVSRLVLQPNEKDQIWWLV